MNKKYRIKAIGKEITDPSPDKIYAYKFLNHKVGDILSFFKRRIYDPVTEHMIDPEDGTKQSLFNSWCYCELEEIGDKELSLTDHYTAMQKECGIKAGDRVKILRNAKNYELGWTTIWNESMSKTVGSESTVIDLNKNGIHLYNGWHYPFFVLEKIENPPLKIVVAGNDVVITNETLTYGCTTLSKEQVELLIEKWNEYHK